MAKLNPDAAAAISSARAGNCRDAMRHLYDAAPHMQTSCESDRYAQAAKDFKVATQIVSGLCTIDKKKRGYRVEAFAGARRRRRRTRRR